MIHPFPGRRKKQAASREKSQGAKVSRNREETMQEGHQPLTGPPLLSSATWREPWSGMRIPRIADVSTP